MSGWILAGSGGQPAWVGRRLLGAEPVGVGKRPAGLHRGDRLGQPRSGVVLGEERLVAAARGGPLARGRWPTTSLAGGGARPVSGRAIRPLPACRGCRRVSWRRNASWSSWRATRSSSAATRARARASSTAAGSAASRRLIGRHSVGLRPGRLVEAGGDAGRRSGCPTVVSEPGVGKSAGTAGSDDGVLAASGQPGRLLLADAAARSRPGRHPIAMSPQP